MKPSVLFLCWHALGHVVAIAGMFIAATQDNVAWTVCFAALYLGSIMSLALCKLPTQSRRDEVVGAVVRDANGNWQRTPTQERRQGGAA